MSSQKRITVTMKRNYTYKFKNLEKAFECYEKPRPTTVASLLTIGHFSCRNTKIMNKNKPELLPGIRILN